MSPRAVSRCCARSRPRTLHSHLPDRPASLSQDHRTSRQRSSLTQRWSLILLRGRREVAGPVLQPSSQRRPRGSAPSPTPSEANLSATA
eukprot:1731537-Rhodomonas_salina.1